MNPDTARAELEAMMETKGCKSDFFDRIEALGEARGEVRRGAKALAAVLKARNLKPSAEQSELVESCEDLDQFDTWITRAATATSVDDVFFADDQIERDNLRALIEANEEIHGELTADETRAAREEIYGSSQQAR